MKKIYNKLVRDNTPAIIAAEGRSCTFRTIDDDQRYSNFLIDKLYEEANEVDSAFYEGNREHLIEELADVQEVLEAICKAKNISLEEIAEAKAIKRKERGAYEQRILLVSTID